VAKILGLFDQALDRTRSLARGLYPVKPEANGLMAALEELAFRTGKHFASACQFTCPEPVLLEDTTVATHLYRIAQEAVTNAIKHGKSERIEIGLIQAPGRLTVSVRDNGVGLSHKNSKKSGMGLRIMRYRAGMIGGSLRIQSEPKCGVAVLCSVEKPG